ncbi:hypothetical protein MGWOODY_Clf2284 [hydrothermal vent metagenome]|uniref:Uncharacterized protein n=1 Tax=hydrothermal vent metagenome TaxID=652676 RepID=A0A160VAR9_9ZZZZ
MSPDHIGHHSTWEGDNPRNYFARSGDSANLKAIQTESSNNFRQHHEEALAEPVKNSVACA